MNRYKRLNSYSFVNIQSKRAVTDRKTLHSVGEKLVVGRLGGSMLGFGVQLLGGENGKGWKD